MFSYIKSFFVFNINSQICSFAAGKRGDDSKTNCFKKGLQISDTHKPGVNNRTKVF